MIYPWQDQQELFPKERKEQTDENILLCRYCDSKDEMSFVKENRNNRDISVMCHKCSMISIIEFHTTSEKTEFVTLLKEQDKKRREKEWERKYDDERGRATPIFPPPRGWRNV